MTVRNMIAVLLLLVFSVSGCGPSLPPGPTGGAAVPSGPSQPEETVGRDEPGEPSPASTPEPTPSPDPMGDRIAAMTTEELVGQLLVAGVQGTRPGGDARQLTEDLRVGGIILFSRNVESASQLAELTNGLKALNREAGNTPLFLCVDEEGGRVSRMPPELADLPSAYDYIQAGGGGYDRGEVLAAQCAAFGFQVDFAPVLDVWSNPDNTVIGKRAFHTAPPEVTVAGTECAYAMMANGVIPVVKHFPGHGDTDTDSHVGLPVVDKSRAELEDQELTPFRFAIEGGSWKPPVGREPTPVPAVMVGHILLSEVDPLLPSSLSPAVVNGLLREELGFDGVVFTDDLTMGAVSNTYGVGEAVVKAVEAGCDMVLVCHGLDNAKAAYHALLFAVEEGTLTRQRLEESARRILSLKEAYQVDDAPVETPDVEGLNEKIRSILP